MKKFFYLAAIAAVSVFTGCTSDDAPVQKPAGGDPNAATPVSFGVYTNTASKANRAVVTDLTKVQTDGIGVFAFEQGNESNETYSKANYMPNFMFNQKVAWDGTATAWVYSPIKYWPNNPGAKVSFFAYAPYKATLQEDAHIQTPETNSYLNQVSPDANGLTLVLGYESKGPAISYEVPADPTKGIDLLWGQETTGSDKAPVDKTKQDIGGTINFKMKHALSAMAFTVQVVNDLVQPQADGGAIAANTTINIKRVSLIGNLASKGTLNLFNGEWKVSNGDYCTMEFGKDQFSTIVKNGIDGEEAKSPINLLAGSWDPTTTNFTDFVTAIPNAEFYIEIEYDVVTTDSNNSKNSSTVTNVINTLTNGGGSVSGTNWNQGKIKLEAGKMYRFDLTLGMTSVKFNVGVEDWSTAIVQEEVDLPKNM